MKFRTIVVALLVLFTAYTIYTMTIADQSLLSFGYQLISSSDTAQVVIDLYIMAFLAICWMCTDSKRLGKSKWYITPFVLLTLVFVSIGPLLYLVFNPRDLREASGE